MQTEKRHNFIKKLLAAVIFILVIIVIAGSSFVFGFKTGREIPKVITVKGVSNLEPGDPDVDFGIFWEAWDLINKEYLKSGEAKNQEKVYGAVKGLVGSLNDPYTEFFSPENNKKFREDIQGNFGGIGAEIGIRKEQLLIISPLKDTPAFRAGLKAGDKIIKINSTSTEDITLNQAVGMIRGPVNTNVVLTVFRDSWEKPREFKIQRAQITVPTLDYEIKDGVVRLELHSFNANSNLLFYQAAAEALGNGVKGMILDLRNNAGGYLDVAIDLSSWFLPRGTLVVSEVGIGNSRDDFRANGNAAFANLPMVVLINEGSASASEILAGTLRDNRKVKLIGEKSFGKGTVQQLESLRDGSSLKITIANWVLPSGKIIEGEGLAPDIEVKLAEEDIEKNRDPQLDKAFEVLRQEIGSR